VKMDEKYAFPFTDLHAQIHHPGMTLREYATIQIFAQMLPERGWESNPKTAVEMADALLAELEKKG
jgi:hypothetical protein